MVNGEPELAGKTDRTQHANGIFTHALRRVSDKYNALSLYVLESTGIIPDTEICDVIIECITGEIAPPNVLIDRAVDVVTQNSTLGIMSRIIILMICGRPESRNFDDFAPKSNMRQTKTTTN